jgi:hypothetical protein
MSLFTGGAGKTADSRCVCRIAKPCVYRTDDLVCQEPQTNKRNGDSACHKMSNKQVLASLERITSSHEVFERRPADASPRGNLSEEAEMIHFTDALRTCP